MSATEASLQILKCSLCDESLSVFPISLSINNTNKTTRNICGRCPNIDEEDVIITRNSMYEALAEHTLFPCRYKPNGCRERMTPSQLKQHEPFCAQRPIFCPHTPLGSCAWQGSKQELFEHFNDKHRFLLIENCITEVDIVTKQEENFLMQLNNDLYIVQFACDGDDDALKINLRIIGTENTRNRFQYYLSFYQTVGESSDTETNVVELFDIDNPQRSLSTSASTCIVQISDLKTALNDPSTIRCRIVIMPSQIVSLMDCTNSSELDEASGGDNNCSTSNGSPSCSGTNGMLINAALQRKLECPVCLSHFKIPVLQCEKGHSLCEACRPQSGTCPECRADFTATRNFALEKILEETMFNCKNDQFGCKYLGIPSELSVHEPNCAYCRTCPLNDREGRECPWMGSLFHILEHGRAIHSDNVLDLDLLIYYFPVVGEEEHDTYLLNRYEQLFTLHFYCDEAANCYWRVQWVGAALMAAGASKANYAYEISLVSVDSHKISVQKPIGVDFLQRERLFADGDNDEYGYLMIPNNQLKPFSNMDSLEYYVRIFPL